MRTILRKECGEISELGIDKTGWVWYNAKDNKAEHVRSHLAALVGRVNNFLVIQGNLLCADGSLRTF